MHERRTAPQLTRITTGEQVREVAGYRHSRLLPCAVVYVHGRLESLLVPTDELVIR